MSGRRSLIAAALGLLGARRRLQLAGVVALSLVVGVLEAVGVGLVLALLGVAVGDGDGDQSSTVQLPILGDLSTAVDGVSDSHAVIVLSAAFAVFFVLRGAVFMGATYAENRFVQMTAVGLSRRMLRGYLALPFEHHVRTSSPELVRNVYVNVQQLAKTVYKPIVDILTSGMIVAALVAVLLVASPGPVAVTAALLGIVLFGLLRLVQRRLQQAGRETQQASGDSLQAVMEGLRGVRDVKTYGAEGHVVDRFTAHRRRMARAAWRKESYRELPRVVLETVLLLAVLGLLVTSVLASGDASTGVAGVGLLAYVGLRLLPPLQTIAASVNDLRFTTVALEEILTDLEAFGVLGEPSPDEVRACRATRSFGLRQAGFTHASAATPALRAVDLEVRVGERLGICGTSGSGKSTLVDLLTGLVAPSSGELVIDGEPIGERRVAWRQTIGVVPQQVFLLDDTVARNVALGVEDHAIDRDRVWWALETAQLAERVRAGGLGLDTLIGEDGLRLSGGQRQRLALARALYAQRPVLVLDEGTAALDAVTEESVLEAIDRLAVAETVVIVTHRLQTLRRCDRIVVLDAGAIAAVGTFGELESAHPLFLASLGVPSPAGSEDRTS